MIHTVFALVGDYDRCLDSLLLAGFNRDEISRLGSEASGPATAKKPFAGLIRGTVGVAAAFTGLGLPVWAAQRYEEGIVRGEGVVAVCTENGWEVDTIAELLRDGGCRVVVSCCPTAIQPPARSGAVA